MKTTGNSENSSVLWRSKNLSSFEVCALSTTLAKNDFCPMSIEIKLKCIEVRGYFLERLEEHNRCNS